MTRTRLIIGCLCLLVVILATGIVFADIEWVRQNDRINTQQTVIKDEQWQLNAQLKQLGNFHRFIEQSCNRLNILRAEDNVSHFADYKVFNVVYIQERSQSALTTRLFGQNVADAFAKSQKTLQVQVRSAVFSTSWTPLTNCKQAVNRQGVAYTAPQPIRFVDQLPPPSALAVPR